jgi:SAM-dependent methyltransferase
VPEFNCLDPPSVLRAPRFFMSVPDTHIFVESPTEAPLRQPFIVQGWVTSTGRINAVALGAKDEQWMTLHERPDVRALFPNVPHVAGFRGEGNFAFSDHGSLELRCHVGETVVSFAHSLIPVELPPDKLQIRQVGSVWNREFFASGQRMLREIGGAVEEAGGSLAHASRVLDFGCGCGRVLRSFGEYPHTGEIWGSDIDAESIAWNRAHLAKIAQFDCNATLPPLAFPDGFFDVVYSVSVFTHLPEYMQFAWLTELRRVLKPGGLLLASLHGERYWKVDPGVNDEVAERGFAYRKGPVTEGLPDFYMVAFHSEDYVKREWSRYFEYVLLKKDYLYGVHDIAVMRRKN